jgi:hypothetical protein
MRAGVTSDGRPLESVALEHLLQLTLMGSTPLDGMLRTFSLS